jgi:glucose-1-phosphate adenylyltransferase
MLTAAARVTPLSHRRRPSPIAERAWHPREVISVVLAGGEGRRLQPLTADRAKPAVSIGGRYRLIDFVLSNLVSSGLHRVYVLTQYKSDALQQHLARAWALGAPLFLPTLDQFVTVVPAQQRAGPEWYRESADAVHQSLDIISAHGPEHVAIFSGDHLFRMDVGQMIDRHTARDADATVAVIALPSREAHRFGVVEVDGDGRVVGFAEKPAQPAELPGRPGWSLVSMGNYLFRHDALVDALGRDAGDARSGHDFGRDVLPSLAREGRLYAYDFAQNRIAGAATRGRGYWRDVGTLEAWFEAHLDLVGADPEFSLDDPAWPIGGGQRALPPARLDAVGAALPRVWDALLGDGSVVAGATVSRSVLGPSVRVEPDAIVHQCVVLEGATIGAGARLRRCVVEAGAFVPPGLELDGGDGLAVVPCL